MRVITTKRAQMKSDRVKPEEEGRGGEEEGEEEESGGEAMVLEEEEEEIEEEEEEEEEEEARSSGMTLHNPSHSSSNFTMLFSRPRALIVSMIFPDMGTAPFECPKILSTPRVYFTLR